jgi:RNA polymerase sigma-70 factor (ECF subfamily)
MSERAAEALMESVPETVTTVAAPAPSFEEAFTLHHRAVFRAAYTLVRDPGLAEDVTQEVFLKLYQHLGSLQDGEHVRPWLLRVATNTALNTLRGRSRSTAREDEFVVAATTGAGGGAAPVGIEADYERRVEIEEARRALSQIKEPMRSCLLLKQQGLSYREIAQTLSINEVNVGSLIARGRKEFMRVYGKIGGRR